MDADGVRDIVRTSLPDPLLRSATEAVFLARRLASEDCRQRYADPEADNLRPFETRAQLEQLLRAVGERHGFRATVVKQPGQPWNHTEISDGRVVVTAATVQKPGGMVVESDYRRGLASTGQQKLFELDGNQTSEAGLPLYVILAHSRYIGLPAEVRKYGHLPGSVSIVCPASDFRCYVYEENLLLRYPDVVRKHVPKEWDQEAVLRYLSSSRKSAMG